MAAVRAKRLIGPTQVAGALFPLPVPAAGFRWKIERVYVVSVGATAAIATLRLGPAPGLTLEVWKTPNVASGEGWSEPFELTLNSTDSLALSVSALDTVIFTATGFELQLP